MRRQAVVISELFKIEDGRIRRIEAVMAGGLAHDGPGGDRPVKIRWVISEPHAPYKEKGGSQEQDPPYVVTAWSRKPRAESPLLHVVGWRPSEDRLVGIERVFDFPVEASKTIDDR